VLTDPLFRKRRLGVEDDLHHALLLLLEVLIGGRGFGQRQVVRGEVVDSEGIVLGEQREDVVDPCLDVGLALAYLNLLVEELQGREGVRGAAVDTAERNRAASRTISIAE